MTNKEKTDEDTQRGTEKGQKPTSKAGKDQVAYWKHKLRKRTFRKGGKVVEIPDWQVRIKHAGKDGWVNLHTQNSDNAASQAREVYRLLVASGWDAVNGKYKPKPKEFPDSPTLGEFFTAVEKNVTLHPKTFVSYCRRFRTIVSDIFEIDAPKKEKFCHKKSALWRERVEKIELARITPKKIEQWRRDFIARAGNNHLKAKENTHSADSAIRCARALFGKQVRRQLGDFPFPAPLPFEGVPVEQLRNPYRSRIDKDALIQAALDELKRENPEGFKIFLLCLMAGLRRNEVDKLKWSSFNWKTATITVEDHAEFSAKTDCSEGVIEVDPQVLEILKPYKEEGDAFVIKSQFKARPHATYTHYRANDHFRTLIDWLRIKGVNAKFPIHTLRKECGRMVTETFGIFAAQKQLRHRDVTTTARYYADDKRATYPRFPVKTSCSQTNPLTPALGSSGSKLDLARDTTAQVVENVPTFASSLACDEAA